MKTSTSKLTGPALDWAVAKCENPDTSIEHFVAMHSAYDHGTFDYSTNWALGGPIIEREGINTSRSVTAPWMAFIYDDNLEMLWIVDGPTPLTAAMRCFVDSKMGDEVDVPEELL